ncbi:MAG TPA: DUF2147 domain-containing protein [Pseudolabrys sp.]|nr:DUF2147 domain-containing protein [Pseudolabrys sp.]
MNSINRQSRKYRPSAELLPPHGIIVLADNKGKEDDVRTLSLSLVLIIPLMATAAHAQDPTGEWQVANGAAHVRIVDCGPALWGVVSWEKRPGRDINNPNPALRQRPTLGMPILLHMRPADEASKWEGEVYNSEDGRTYDASIAIRSADTLHIEGCALGIFCGGENWTRVTQPASVASRTRARQTTGTRAPSRSPAAAICSRVAASTRGSH